MPGHVLTDDAAIRRRRRSLVDDLALAPRLQDTRSNLGHRGKIEPEAGVRRDEQRDLPVQLAGEHGPLDVPARKSADRDVRRRRANVERRDRIESRAPESAAMDTDPG